MGETLQSVGFVNFPGRPASSPLFLHAFPRNHRAILIPPLSLAWAPEPTPLKLPAAQAPGGDLEAFLVGICPRAPCSSVPAVNTARNSVKPEV